jgi:hypothetical protein
MIFNKTIELNILTQLIFRANVLYFNHQCLNNWIQLARSVILNAL